MVGAAAAVVEGTDGLASLANVYPIPAIEGIAVQIVANIT